MKQRNTAVLIFANSGQTEATRKSILNSEQLFKRLNEQTLKTVEKSELPYVHISESQQIGDSFGERFTNAIKSVYAKGFENIITIGNDTPHLTAAQLKETACQLEHNKFVLGPSTDGGFYLMGLHKSQFNEKLFVKLPWQSRRLAKHITLLLSTAKVDVVKLGVLQDIDTEKDITIVLNAVIRISRELHALLAAIINSGIKQTAFTLSEVRKLWFPRIFNKGSPIVLNS